VMGEHEAAPRDRGARGLECQRGDDRAHAPGDEELGLKIGRQPPQLPGVARDVSGRPHPRADPTPRRQTALADRQHAHACGPGRVGEWSLRTRQDAVLQRRGDVKQDLLGAAGSRGEGDDQTNRPTPGAIGFVSFSELGWIIGAFMLTLVPVEQLSRDDGGFSGMGE
jgi:hypothetical protein